jgi:hypothetical protein
VNTLEAPLRQTMHIIGDIVRDIPWYGWIAIVAIISGTTRSVIAASHRHEQRMEMIKRGLDPSSIKDSGD